MDRKIAIIGAGNGGLALAADLASLGHSMVLQSRNEHRISKIKKDGIVLRENSRSSRIKSVTATTSAKEAVDRSDIILVCVPAYAQEEVRKTVGARVRKDQLVILLSGYAGAINFRKSLGLNIVSETSTLPYSSRVTDENVVSIFARMKVRLAAFPSSGIDDVLQSTEGLFETIRSKNVLETALLNPNIPLVPVPIIMNMGSIDQLHRKFSIVEGITENVITVMDALDQERVMLCRKLGVESLTMDQIFKELGLTPYYRKQRPLVKSNDRMPERYLCEEISCGLTLISTLGDQFDIKTPLIDGIIAISSIVRNTDFMRRGRTTRSLGIQNMNLLTLNNFLNRGK